MFKGILFDFDGTLADSLPMYLIAYDLTLKKLGYNFESHKVSQTCFGKTPEEICVDIGAPEKTKEFAAIYVSNLKEVFSTVNLFPGVIDILELVKESGIKMGIVTFAYGWYIKEMVKMLGIGSYFVSVLSFDDVKKQKPDPEIVIKSCGRLNIKAREALVIGDSEKDILMGKNAGSKTALFIHQENGEFYDFDALKKEAALDFIIKDISDFKQLLKK